MIATHQSVKWRIVLCNLVHQLFLRTYAQRCIKCVSPALLLGVLNINSHANTEIEELRPRIGQEWVQVQNDKRQNIRAYIRHEEHKRYRSFKADIILETNIKTLANVLLDFNNYTKWYWKASNAQLLKKVSNTHFILYIVHDVPYNLPDLDVILDATVEPQSINRPHITVKVAALPNYLPLKPPLQRMMAEDMSIRITPIANNKVHMEVHGYFEAPNNVLPIWAANMIQRTAPYTVLSQLKKMTNQVHYQQTSTPIGFPVYEYDELP